MAKLTLILLSAAITGAGVSVPAAAEDNDDRRSVLVRYHDLNLASVEGRAKLDSRVKSAVRKVCNSRPKHRPTLHELALAQECEAATLADAEVKLAGLLNGAGGTQLADRGQPILISAP